MAATSAATSVTAAAAKMTAIVLSVTAVSPRRDMRSLTGDDWQHRDTGAGPLGT